MYISVLLNDVIIVLDIVIAGTSAAAATADLKMIDHEMQAILAELLMPAPQATTQPQLPFPLPAENTVMSDLVDNSQPQILPPQLMQTPGALLIFCHKTLQTAVIIILKTRTTCSGSC